ncbi:hypothetical protein BDA99DRAFT_502351 [Phascolomyces articulosus]|uniref:MARVEL domain-containing protein n=1 Tax=Phascolomyces articulosus TaxID=60185 RepID=A0AAD5PH00_9FUNG|nr:hypothetical protein BDA99DRAFT_502351 [Phascolomyces articulosus]
MNCRIIFLNFIRFLIFFFSAGTLACHIAQMILFDNSDWWPQYKVYTLYYVGAGFSFICSIALLFVSFMRNIRSIRGDRIVSVINIALLIAVIIYGTLEAGPVPVLPVDQIFSSGQLNLPSQKGFATYCSDYHVANDQSLQQRITNRCWLQNGTWLGLIITAALWIVLALYTFLQKKSTVYNDKDGHDYIEDVPMAIDHGNTPSPAAYAVADLHNQSYQQYPGGNGSPVQHYEPVPAGGVAPYPTYYNYYDADNTQYPAPQRQMSYSTDYSGSGVPLYNTAGGSVNGNQPPPPPLPQQGYTFPYGEKVAATPSLSERSASEPPHSHDGARV